MKVVFAFAAFLLHFVAAQTTLTKEDVSGLDEMLITITTALEGAKTEREKEDIYFGDFLTEQFKDAEKYDFGYTNSETIPHEKAPNSGTYENGLVLCFKKTLLNKRSFFFMAWQDKEALKTAIFQMVFVKEEQDAVVLTGHYQLGFVKEFPKSLVELRLKKETGYIPHWLNLINEASLSGELANTLLLKPTIQEGEVDVEGRGKFYSFSMVTSVDKKLPKNGRVVLVKITRRTSRYVVSTVWFLDWLDTTGEHKALQIVDVDTLNTQFKKIGARVMEKNKEKHTLFYNGLVDMARARGKELATTGVKSVGSYKLSGYLSTDPTKLVQISIVFDELTKIKMDKIPLSSFFVQAGQDGQIFQQSIKQSYIDPDKQQVWGNELWRIA